MPKLNVEGIVVTWQGKVVHNMLFRRNYHKTKPVKLIINISRPGFIYIGSKGYDGAPDCAKNEYAPEGIASADIVNEFAENHDLWQESFWDAWEKMGLNGYDVKDMGEGPSNWHFKTYQ